MDALRKNSLVENIEFSEEETSIKAYSEWLWNNTQGLDFISRDQISLDGKGGRKMLESMTPASRKRKFLELCFDVEEIYTKKIQNSMQKSESLTPNNDLVHHLNLLKDLSKF